MMGEAGDRESALHAEVVALERALEAVHATDANGLRRRHVSLKQHVDALAAEVEALGPAARRVSGCTARLVDLILAAGAGGCLTLLPKARWAALLALALLAAARSPKPAMVAEGNEELLARWAAVEARCGVMRDLLADLVERRE